MTGGGRIDNREGGVLTSGNLAIRLEGDELTTLTNEGIIRGYVAAIASSADAPLTLINRGLIIGDLFLGTENDRIDTRGGSVKGVIHGGEGDDTYLISDTATRIDDNGASIFDTVRSTASYTLVGGLDDLYLLGTKNIDATGNVGSNNLSGNRGQNTLSGMDGADVLNGGGGRDLLNGGNDRDTFIFEKGNGIDRIVDFTTDEFISSEWVTSQRQFDRLDIRQVGDDVLIDFGHGDRLWLDDFERGNLSYGMFQLPD